MLTQEETAVTNRAFARNALLDLLTSLLAAFLTALAIKGAHIFDDMRELSLVTGLVFLAAGLGRGNGLPERYLPANRWIKGLLLAGVFASMLVVVPSGSRLRVRGTAALVAYLAAVAGITARRAWQVNRARGLVMVLGTVAAITVVSALGGPLIASRLLTENVDRPAPSFRVMRLDGTLLDSSAFRGKVLLLDFWATWCAPCSQEFPALDRLYRRYLANPNVVFLAVDVRMGDETPEKARAFVQKAGYTIPIAYDAQDAVNPLKVEGYPCLLLLDKAGHIRLQHLGYDGSEPFVPELSARIDALLAEP